MVYLRYVPHRVGQDNHQAPLALKSRGGAAWRRGGTQTRDLQPFPGEPQVGPSPGRGLLTTLGMDMPGSGKGHSKGIRQGLGSGTVGRVGTQRREQNPHRTSEEMDAVRLLP